MEYQKIINLLNNTQNEPSKFRTKNWVEINNGSRETYNKSNQTKCKASMIRPNVRDYSDVYILVCVTITITGSGNYDAEKWADERRNKRVILKNCAPFTVRISNTNNTQMDNTKDTDVVMPM